MPAVAVPLVALGTQSGTIDVIDVSANAVAASFSVHSGVVRGLRWLGNSRLVSFSYTQVVIIYLDRNTILGDSSYSSFTHSFRLCFTFFCLIRDYFEILFSVLHSILICEFRLLIQYVCSGK